MEGVAAAIAALLMVVPSWKRRWTSNNQRNSVTKTNLPQTNKPHSVLAN
jgi:hypothetical protein